ncbi:MAG: thioredoxin-disulfide reductase [Ruminococcus sp.]|nr:thioredoxin-disulfide reductase [Ruminococcus sp.]
MADIIIVGAGPAGLTAAIYAQRAGRKALVFEAAVYGGQIVNTPEIENYPAIKKISGFEFATALYEQATSLGAEVKMERVISVTDNGSSKTVKTDNSEYECKAVILATGAKNRTLGLENEKALIGKGVSYCATCDGMFFRGKTVAVAGGGNTAIEDALFLSNYCEKVYIIHRRDRFRAHEAEVAKLKGRENVELVLNKNVTALKEDGGRLCGVEVTDKLTGEKSELAVAGLFVAIGQAPDNTPFENVATLDNGGYIVAGEDCKTGIAGIFTAGDCRTKQVRQLTTAASDGAAAALAACSYIDSL